MSRTTDSSDGVDGFRAGHGVTLIDAGFGGGDPLAQLAEHLCAGDALTAIELVDGGIDARLLCIVERRVDGRLVHSARHLGKHLDAIVGEGVELGSDRIDGLGRVMLEWLTQPESKVSPAGVPMTLAARAERTSSA